MSRYSPQFKKAITAWLNHVMPFMGISAWEINLLESPPSSDDAGACIDCIYGRKVANLELSLDFYSFPRHTQEHYLIHELVHVMFNAIDDVIDHSNLETIMGKPAQIVFTANYNTAMEGVVDQVAETIRSMFTGGRNYKRLFDAVIEAEK